MINIGNHYKSSPVPTSVLCCHMVRFPAVIREIEKSSLSSSGVVIIVNILLSKMRSIEEDGCELRVKRELLFRMSLNKDDGQKIVDLNYFTF
jgi:hypothetical protein